MIRTKILELFADLKVDDFDFATILIEEDIVGLEISMTYSFRMQVAHSEKNFF